MVAGASSGLIVPMATISWTWTQGMTGCGSLISPHGFLQLLSIISFGFCHGDAEYQYQY